MTGAEPVTDRRGGDSRARRNAAEMNRQSLKRQTPPTCHCEGASCPWQSREGTCSPYRPPSKRHAPIASVAALTAQPLAALPPYGCGVPRAGCERLAGCRFGGTPPTAPALVGERHAAPGDALVICTNRRQNGKRPRLVIARRPKADVAISGRQSRFRRWLSCYPAMYCEIATSLRSSQ